MEFVEAADSCGSRAHRGLRKNVAEAFDGRDTCRYLRIDRYAACLILRDLNLLSAFCEKT